MAYDFVMRCEELENYLGSIHSLFYESDLLKLKALKLTEVERNELRHQMHNLIKEWTEKNKENVM